MNANHTLDLVRDAVHATEDRAYRTFHALACLRDCDGFDLALDYACGARWGAEDAPAFADRERLRGLLSLHGDLDLDFGTEHGLNAARLGLSAASIRRAHALVLELRTITRTARERREAYLALPQHPQPGGDVWLFPAANPSTPYRHPTCEPYVEHINPRLGLNVYRFWGGWVAEIFLPEDGPATLRLLGPDERGPVHPLTSSYARFRREWPDEQPERVALWLEQGDRVRSLVVEQLPFRSQRFA